MHKFRGVYPPPGEVERGVGAHLVRRGLKAVPCPRVEETQVTLRKLPGAAGLGLLAFLAAHAATFGSEHSVGGTLHGTLLATALAAALGFVLAAVAVACAGHDAYADGTVLASRLRALLPGAGAMLVSASAWFALIEGREGAHASASYALVVAALLAASWLVHLCARALLRFVGAIAVVIARFRFVPRLLTWLPRTHDVVRAVREPERLRRFARPPPGSMHVACIH